MMKILGIESSCDETSAAVVEDGSTLLSNVVATSLEIHVKYGGVVPENAARAQMESIIPVVKEALETAQCTWDDIDGIAVVYGPGLSGSLLVGLLAARTLAIVKGKPLYAVNHMEGHVFANFLTSTTLPGYTMPAKQPEFPCLALIVSGGHTQFAIYRNYFDYTLLGQTQDDAVGEAFDKVAKILGLPYPGGPSIAKAAATGDTHKYDLPKARLANKYDFSFSGLKTATLRLAQRETGHDFTFPSYQLPEALSEAQKHDIAASFERIALETIVDKAVMAYEEFQPASVIIAGGVAASRVLRDQLTARLPVPIEYADPKLCTDNGAMVAAYGCYQAMHKQPQADPFSLAIEPNLAM